MSVPRAIRRRWWVVPAVIAVVAVAIVVKIITAPLEVSANVSDGDQTVARTAALDLHFNRDMKADSVQQAFHISPAVPVAVREVSPKEFQFHPTMAPDTAYHVTLTNAESTSGSRVTTSLSFKTEPAPTVSSVQVNGTPVADAQQAVRPTGAVQLTFTQPMDGPRTPVGVNGTLLPASQLKWSDDGHSVTLDLRLGHSRQYQLSIPQSALNRKRDPFATDWKFLFTTRIEVASAGNTDRIGNGAPIIVQIENSIDARPQAGMQQADLVYEYISEGSIPRLTAVYWHPLPDLVGPVRSCRLITIQIQAMYNAFIYCSGGNDYILGKIWGANLPSLINDWSFGKGNVFFRATNRYAPHNVMMHGTNATVYSAGANTATPNYDIAPAHPDTAVTGDPVSQIVVPDHNAVWRYDPARKEYVKTQDGAPLNNVGTGRVHAKAVIVENVTSYLDMDPRNVFHGYHTEYYELKGTGKADIYLNGVVIHGTWFHPDPSVPTVYLDQDGNPIDLDTGLTWVHVIGSTKWHNGL